MKKIIKNIIMILAFIFIMISLLILYTFLTPPIKLKNASNIVFYDNKKQVFAMGNGTNNWTPIKDISTYIIDATISIEDKNFYNHVGLDFLRIIRASMINVKNNDKRQGASTITQQLARNQFLTLEKTWSRKLKEAFLALELEAHYSKEKILEAYLNTINYGHGVYGIKDASKYYFDKEINELSLAEASLLAGLPQAPAKLDPSNHFNNAKKRQKQVLKSMLVNNKINKQEYQVAIDEQLTIDANKNNIKAKTIPYYQNAVMKELLALNIVSGNTIQNGELKIYTTFDQETQIAIENSIDHNLLNHELETFSIASNPQTGAIKALVGGRDFDISEFNRAINSKRQIGSTVKPFLYYTALENGFTPTTKFKSAKTTFLVGNHQTYSPQNYNNIYPNKEITLAAAIAYSDNVYAVKTHMFLGSDALNSTLKRVGVKDKLASLPSSALGTNSMNGLSLLQAYNTLASGGFKTTPYFIEKVVNSDNKVIYKHKNHQELVLNPNYTFILNDLLTNCANPIMKDYTTPTCISISNRITKKYAMKSGTTNTDSWMVGYNPDLSLITWVGYDNNNELSKEDTKFTKLIWAESIENALINKPENWYQKPENIEAMLINPLQGTIVQKQDNKAKIFYFMKGSNIESKSNLEKMIQYTENIDKTQKT